LVHLVVQQQPTAQTALHGTGAGDHTENTSAHKRSYAKMRVSPHAFGVGPFFNALAPTSEVPAISVTDRTETMLASQCRLNHLKQFSQQDFTKPSADVSV